MSPFPGTNYFGKLDSNVNISLTNELGFAVEADCTGNPNVVAIQSNVFNNGCLIIRNDILSGDNRYINTGTLANPLWISNGNVGGVSSLNSLTGAVVLLAGSGITLLLSGQTITISSSVVASSSLADVSSNSTTTIKSLYTMTSAVPVEFRTASGTTAWKISDTAGLSSSLAYAKFGNANPFLAITTGLEVWGSDNTINGVQVGSGNRSSGTSAYTGYFLNNDLAVSGDVTHFAFMGLNSSTYTDTTFGTALAVANQFSIQNTDGPISMIANVNSTQAYFNWVAKSTATSGEVMRLTSGGFLGLGNTAPGYKIESATTSSGVNIAATTWSTAANTGAIIGLARARSSTVGTHGNVTTGDAIGAVSFLADSASGGNFAVSAQISAAVDAVTSGHALGRLVFSTNRTGGTLTEALRLDSSGNTIAAGTMSATGLTLTGPIDAYLPINGTPGLRLRQGNVPANRWWDQTFVLNGGNPALQFSVTTTGTTYYPFFITDLGKFCMGDFSSLSPGLISALSIFTAIGGAGSSSTQGITIWDAGTAARVALGYTTAATPPTTYTAGVQVLAFGSSMADLALTSRASVASGMYFYTSAGSTLALAMSIDSAQKVGIGVTPTSHLHIGGNLSKTAWTTNGISFNSAAASFTDTSSSGTVATNTVNAFGIPTLLASSATTYTNSANVYIAGAPIASTNVTQTNPLALYVASGASSFAGNVGLGTTAPTAYLHLAAGTAAASTAPLKFTSGTSLTTPEAGALEYDGGKLWSTNGSTIRESLVGCIFTQTADKSVTNTLTETSIVGTGTGYGLTLPANFFLVGKTIRVIMSGVYSTVAVTGDTVTIKIKYGSTVIASQATTSLLAGATNLFWWAEALVTCRSTGGTGTVQISGSVRYQVASSAVVENELNNSAGTTTIDTTTSNLFDVTVTHSAANASNTVKSLVSSFEIIN